MSEVTTKWIASQQPHPVFPNIMVPCWILVNKSDNSPVDEQSNFVKRLNGDDV